MDVGELIALLGELPARTPVHKCTVFVEASVFVEAAPGLWTTKSIGTDEHLALEHRAKQ